MRIHHHLLIGICLFMIPIWLYAQNPESCTQIYQDALDIASTACDELSSNSVCYGNNQINIKTQKPDIDIEFEAPGDQINISDIDTIELGAMELEQQAWGIALLRLQAINLENTLPGQHVTFIAFGDTQLITDPSSSSLTANETGQILESSTAFYIQTGFGTTTCVDALANGLLIQTEKGRGSVTFQLNGIDIHIGSTIFIQAFAEDSLSLYTLEGDVTVTIGEIQQEVPQGTVVYIPMTDDLLPDGLPSLPAIFNPEQLRLLPLDLLPESVTLSPLETIRDTLLTQNGYVLLINPDKTPVNSTWSLSITATRPWIATPIQLSAGQTITFKASGEAQSCGSSDCDPYYGQIVNPNGIPGDNCGDCIMPNTAEMRLVGRIGNGSPFAIGTGKTLTATQDGTLYLAANDSATTYGDNVGAYDVTITIE